MKIGLISSVVPHVLGGYRNIVDWTAEALVREGHEVETVYLPFVEEPAIFWQQMNAYRGIKLDDYFDRVVTFRPPAHVVSHPRKVVWFIHHFRAFYDLWTSEYCYVPHGPRAEALRRQLIATDTIALREAHRLFCNSRTVADRVATFNDLDSSVLYPPVHAPERFVSSEYGDEIVSVCRMEHHKRQHLLVEAMAHTRTSVRLRLCGVSGNPSYVDDLRARVARRNLSDRVTIDDRWISEDAKVALLSTALANAYVPVDEDSYGYPTLEAAHAARCTVSTTDAGGVSEFVRNGTSGFVVDPDPQVLGEIFDRLHDDRSLARRLGERARAQIPERGISWRHVVEQLLS